MQAGGRAGLLSPAPFIKVSNTLNLPKLYPCDTGLGNTPVSIRVLLHILGVGGPMGGEGWMPSFLVNANNTCKLFPELVFYIPKHTFARVL